MLPTRGGPTVGNQPPLPELAAQFLESKRVERNLRDSSLEEYRRDLRDFCLWFAARRRKAVGAVSVEDLASVDRDTASWWLAHQADRELAPATRDRRWSTVSGWFRWMVAEGVLPVTRSPAPSGPRGVSDTSDFSFTSPRPRSSGSCGWSPPMRGSRPGKRSTTPASRSTIAS
ncbi:MAG: hypothetical protein DIU71_19080 [Proteobacteria bacterium]|nr:MAG: hypothetical protein DIU71_19080 [Pseudomonadota bacterium]